jgi:hypothetical protein
VTAETGLVPAVSMMGSGLPNGRNLITLLDAATYATRLPKKEADTAEWQAAIESLMRGIGRTNDVCADWRHEGVEPP